MKEGTTAKDSTPPKDSARMKTCRFWENTLVLAKSANNYHPLVGYTFEVESNHSSEAPHLQLRNIMLRMTLQPRINDLLYHTVLVEVVGNDHRILAVLLHTQFQGLQRTHRQVAVERRRHCSQ
jgi:hypothetical protein